VLWRKITAKIGRKNLEEKLKELDNPLSAQDRTHTLVYPLGKTLSL